MCKNDSKYPETLYVKEIEEREPADNFLMASADPADLSEPDAAVRVAEYKLIKIRVLINETKFSD